MAQTQIYQFGLPEICAGCVQGIEEKFNTLNQIIITGHVVNILDKNITIVVEEPTWQTQTQTLLAAALDDLGLNYTSTERAPGDHNSASNPKGDRKTSVVIPIIKGVVGTVLGFALMIMMIIGVDIPLIGMYILAGVSTLISLYLGKEVYVDAISKLFKAKTLTMDSLFTISSTAAIGVSIASLFVPQLPMMFDAPLLMFGFRHLGKAIEESMKHKVISGLTFQARVPKKITLLLNEEAHQIAVEQLLPGNKIQVLAGQVIPVDGICDNEAAFIFDTIITGETNARRYSQGAKVYAGMKVAETSAPLIISVTHTAANSYLSRADAAFKAATVERAPLESSANRALQYFIPAVLVLSAISGVVVGLSVSTPLAIQSALSVLVAACPCTLGLIVPLAIKIGTSKVAEHGAQIKSGQALQSAAEADVAVFDFTGSLTTGILQVGSLKLLTESLSEKEIRDYIFSIEKQSSHVVASAICSAWNSCHEVSVTHVDTSHHAGIRAVINDSHYIVGNHTIMRHHGIQLDAHEQLITTHAHEHLVFLAREKSIIAYVTLTDPLRDDARSTVRSVQRLGIEAHLCTGANAELAYHGAKQLGIPFHLVKPNCISIADELNYPGVMSKAGYIESLKAKGHRVMMIGDGGNDAVAMENCLGFAVKSSAADEMTQHYADIISSSLTPIMTTIIIARKTVSNIKMCLRLNFVYNVLTIIVAGGLLPALNIKLSPGVDAGFMIVQSSIVFFNAYVFKQSNVKVLTDSLASIEAQEIPVPEQTSSALFILRKILCCHENSRDNTDVGDMEKKSLIPSAANNPNQYGGVSKWGVLGRHSGINSEPAFDSGSPDHSISSYTA